MKVLIVTFAFPPSNVIGAVRVGKLARYLDRRGHDVRVLTTDVVEDRSLPLEIPREHVIYTDYRRRTYRIGQLLRYRRRSSADARLPKKRDGDPAHDADHSSLPWMALRRQYLSLINIPDMRVDWIKTAVPAGRRLITEWRPDVIFASAPPFTGFIIASRLARASGIAWVADFRDLWADNVYYSEPGWRRIADALLERVTLRNAAGLVTVSPVWAQELHRRHGKPAEVVYNGYAEEDFPPFTPGANRGEVLTIRYLGSIYPGFRDPSAVFAAIALLPDAIRDRVVVEFFTDSPNPVLAAAAAHQVTDAAIVSQRVPYHRALGLQMEADVLLLLQSNDQRDEGNLPAKLFEYLYARRPILMLGYEQGIAARFINERGAGLVSNNPAIICNQLQVWVSAKQIGRLKNLDPSVSVGLSRDEQYRKLEDLFDAIVNDVRRRSRLRSGAGEAQ